MIPLVKVGLPSKENLMPQLEDILYSGMIGEGDAVYEFEKRFQKMFGVPNSIAMSSGTAALHASLILSGVKPGDEVITTSMTAEPTNIAILQVGAIPIFADVDILSGNLEPSSIEDKIGNKTKAIIIVHYAGIPCKLKEISDIAKRHNISLIEDCAHALGARYEENGIGSIGDFGIFSFQAIKHMTTVDGGFLSFRDNNKLRDAKKFRWFGMEKGISRTEIDITSIGYKYNMHNVAATIGLAQLNDIDKRLSKHIDNGNYFDKEIPSISGLTVPVFDSVAKPSYWLYTIFSEESENIEKILNGVGVQASKLHRPNHLHSIFRQYSCDLPQLDKYYKRMIHIPCGWWVDLTAREMIVDALKKG
ncbi:DegT/DnrJ/EryC1/StrS family aminotransferase [Shewanella frigidimarina]|uniref:DegT/DnrJ/EryC1/StrS family aminotransferase n=1 Tax=Shewanella frigidimarina TaxID=56812 RepID=UPI000F4E7B7C|nr:DegT/DnrJ/EryC1/StrS family aminotransferase [Shewanella frigidimarina]RPA63843.1 DegT/DnrJ/EryC1/StrS family aminotransferase [Shewanella frigidimarina]